MIQRVQCNPKKRIALFSCTIENNIFVIHMVDIITPQMSTSKPHLFSNSKYMMAMDECLNKSLSLFNHNLLEPLRITKFVQLSKRSTPTQVSYNFEYIKLALPADQIRFLGALGAMDGFIHLLIHETKALGYAPKIMYMPKMPELTGDNVDSLLAEWIPDHPLASSSEEQPLSRLLSHYMISITKHNERRLQSYAGIISFLQDVNLKTDGSLSPFIRMQLYPNKAAQQFVKSLERLIGTRQGLVHYLLNPEVDLAKKATETVAYMRTDLSRYDGDEKPHLKQDYENLFLEFEKQKQYLWFAMLREIYGNPAFDGGILEDRRSTEITLLKESKFILNKQGLLVIQFLATDPYRNYYAKNKINHDKIHEELNLLFKYLGFVVEAGQDYHNPAGIVLTRQTTHDLLCYGFHYSKEYVKDLLRISHAVWRAQDIRFGATVFEKIKNSGTQKELITSIFAKILKHPVLLEDVMTLLRTKNKLPKISKKADPIPTNRHSPSRK